jgi:very-short-patch-repair endonuclease
MDFASWSGGRFWLVLRVGVQGTAFMRQVVLGEQYITDLLPPSIVVEVDGGVHRERRTADRRRDERLGRLGFRVVRVGAQLVLRDPERALEIIRAELREGAAPRRPAAPSIERKRRILCGPRGSAAAPSKRVWDAGTRVSESEHATGPACVTRSSTWGQH